MNAKPVSGAHVDGETSRRHERGASRAGIIGAVLLIGVVFYVVAQSFRIDSKTCEVCMAYRGQSQCRTVSGASEDEARQGAITNACAFISSGVTDTMACGRGKPTSERCW